MARINQVSQEELSRIFGTSPVIPEGGALKAVDLADTLATRKIQRDKAMLDIQKEIEAAKQEAAQRKQIQSFATLQNPNAPLSTAVPATFANVQGGEEQRQGDISQLEANLLPEEIIKRRSKAAEGKAELAKQLQEQKGAQKLEQIRLEALLRPAAKKNNAATSFMLKQGAQSGGTDAFIKDIEDKVAKMSQGAGVKGGIAALKGRVQQNAKGFLGGNAEIQAFEEARPSFGRRLYKQLSNDVGNISENEGKFATDLIPSQYEAPERRTAKLIRLKELSEASKKAVSDIVAKVQSGDLDPKDAQDLVKSTVVGLMQEAASKPLPTTQASPTAPGSRSFKVISVRPSQGQ